MQWGMTREWCNVARVHASPGGCTRVTALCTCSLLDDVAQLGPFHFPSTNKYRTLAAADVVSEGRGHGGPGTLSQGAHLATMHVRGKLEQQVFTDRT